jgi:hypothetical protein
MLYKPTTLKLITLKLIYEEKVLKLRVKHIFASCSLTFLFFALGYGKRRKWYFCPNFHLKTIGSPRVYSQVLTCYDMDMLEIRKYGRSSVVSLGLLSVCN